MPQAAWRFADRSGGRVARARRRGRCTLHARRRDDDVDGSGGGRRHGHSGAAPCEACHDRPHRRAWRDRAHVRSYPLHPSCPSSPTDHEATSASFPLTTPPPPPARPPPPPLPPPQSPPPPPPPPPTGTRRRKAAPTSPSRCCERAPAQPRRTRMARRPRRWRRSGNGWASCAPCRSVPTGGGTARRPARDPLLHDLLAPCTAPACDRGGMTLNSNQFRNGITSVFYTPSASCSEFRAARARVRISKRLHFRTTLNANNTRAQQWLAPTPCPT